MRIKTWMALTGVSALALLLFAFPSRASANRPRPQPKAPHAPQLLRALRRRRKPANWTTSQPKRRTSRLPMIPPPRQIGWPQRACSSRSRRTIWNRRRSAIWTALTANLANLQSDELAKEAASLTHRRKSA